jgi:hypothetical protein
LKKILASFPAGVYETLRSLKGELGESDSEIVRNIVIAYLSEQGFFSQTSVKGIASQKRKKANEKNL